MRVVSGSQLGTVLGGLPGIPRVVVSGNFATPWQAVTVVDKAVAQYRLFALNAQAGVPDRDGVTLEPEDVRAHCATQLARFKVPTVVEVVDRLPHSATGKITRAALRAVRGAG